MKKLVNKLNKKGQDLSIGTLILIVLGIVVLVLLILGFSMGWDNLWEKINIFGGTSSIGDVVTACKLAVTSQDTYTFCQKTWTIKQDRNGDGKADKFTVTCRDSLVQPSLNGALQCSEGTAKSCKGTPVECTTLTNQADCAKQTGCSWTVPAPPANPSCTGTAVACENRLSQTDCESQKNCAWQ